MEVRNAEPPFSTTSLKQDFLASIVVFLVALPLCMGIAIASGAPVASGLITGIVGGLVVGWISGCPFQVSGPAAGLTVIVYDVVQRFGLEMLGLVVLSAGLIQLAAGGLRLGQWFRGFSGRNSGNVGRHRDIDFGQSVPRHDRRSPQGDGPAKLGNHSRRRLEEFGMASPDGPNDARLRAESLRRIGELHRRQVAIRERVGEHTPHEGERPEIAQRVDAHPADALAASFRYSTMSLPRSSISKRN